MSCPSESRGLGEGLGGLYCLVAEFSFLLQVTAVSQISAIVLADVCASFEAHNHVHAEEVESESK